jgi:hypothetical protein
MGWQKLPKLPCSHGLSPKDFWKSVLRAAICSEYAMNNQSVTRPMKLQFFMLVRR